MRLFDLNTKDLIRTHAMWFDLWCDQITNFSNLGQQIITTLWVFLLQ